jgi:2-polyprenyl-6-methoxyphenol hydroxylase-like FAD-dependent oxidoreductase
MKVIIIGAGIGGLCAGIAARQAGLEVEIYERAGELQPLGAGLSIWVNAIRALDLLGLGDAFRAIAVPNSGSIITCDGRPLSRMTGERVRERFGEAVWGVHRGDLQTLLLHALGPDALHLGADYQGFEQDAARVTIRFADGRTARGDMLVSADGLQSLTRQTLFPKSIPRYAGYTAWRGVTVFSHPALPPEQNFEAWGCGQRFGTVHLTGGRVYWFATANAPAGAGDPPQGRKADLRARFLGWLDPIAALIEATDEGAILRHDIHDIDPLPRWRDRRVTLLGDAAHATTPNMGQGACQAIEDAAVLGQVLASFPDPVAALREYEARRKRRTAMIIRRSRQIGRLGQWSNPALCRLRNTLLRRIPAGSALKQLEGVLSYDSRL